MLEAERIELKRFWKRHVFEFKYHYCTSENLIDCSGTNLATNCLIFLKVKTLKKLNWIEMSKLE